ncbi:MAG: AbrB/MazE/SpoVT family DNA-binding domain-containing protein [Dongiaceae bacterium]
MQIMIAKWGNSLGLRLPRALADQLGFSPGQAVEIRAEGRRLIVESARPRYTLDELLAQCDAGAPFSEADRGWTGAPPAGRELI